MDKQIIKYKGDEYKQIILYSKQIIQESSRIYMYFWSEVNRIGLIDTPIFTNTPTSGYIEHRFKPNYY